MKEPQKPNVKQQMEQMKQKEQQMQKYSRMHDINRRLLAEDMDSILLMDGPSSLRPWHIPFE